MEPKMEQRRIGSNGNEYGRKNMADKHKLILGTANDALPIVAYGTNERFKEEMEPKSESKKKGIWIFTFWY